MSVYEFNMSREAILDNMASNGGSVLYVEYIPVGAMDHARLVASNDPNWGTDHTEVTQWCIMLTTDEDGVPDEISIWPLAPDYSCDSDTPILSAITPDRWESTLWKARNDCLVD